MTSGAPWQVVLRSSSWAELLAERFSFCLNEREKGLSVANKGKCCMQIGERAAFPLMYPFFPTTQSCSAATELTLDLAAVP